MLELGRPALLLAGAAAALLPLLLHLISRRPRDRAPLPTYRFLQPERRTFLRLRRRPTDLLLLALRMLLLLLVGAALSGPLWLPEREGTADVVLLDRGAAMAAGWEAAVSEAERILVGDPAAGARGPLVLFDSVAEVVPASRVTSAYLDSLRASGPGDANADYRAALGALPSAAATLPRAVDLRATLLSRLRVQAWGAGLPAVRDATWPARIELWEPGIASAGGPGAGAGTGAGGEGEGGRPEATRNGDVVAHGTAVLLGPGGRFVGAALAATGWTVRTAAQGELPSDPALFVVLGPLPAAARAELTSRAAAGATVLFVGRGAIDSAADLAPWAQADDGAESAARRGSAEARGPADPPASATTGEAGTRPGSGDAPGTATSPGKGAAGAATGPAGAAADAAAADSRAAMLVLPEGSELPGVVGRVGGEPGDRARVIAAWSDGTPAAAARPVGRGCVVAVAAALERGAAVLSPEYPRTVDRLARACASPAAATAATPLDAGARALLSRPDLPATASAPDLAPATAGIHLGPWLLGAALLVALLETWLAYRPRSSP